MWVSGSPLAWENISSIYQSTPSAKHWRLEKRKRFHCSMLSPAAMPHRPSREKEKSLRGSYGSFSERSGWQVHSVRWQICGILCHGAIFLPVLYDNDSSASKVNATRRHLFTKKGRPLESIPPTQVCRFDVEYEFFYDSGSTRLYQSNSSFLALILLSKRPLYITLIEQRTKRASRWSQ